MTMLQELTVGEIDQVSGGVDMFGVAGGALVVAGAALGGLAVIAAPEIAVPIAVAAGATGGFGGIMGMIDGLVKLN